LWKSNTQILRKIAFPSSQYELFGLPSQTLQWRPAVVLELGSTESARGADRTNQITGQDGSPSLYNEPMTLDPQTSEHENGSATKYLIRFGRGHTERLFIILLIQRHAQVSVSLPLAETRSIGRLKMSCAHNCTLSVRAYNVLFFVKTLRIILI